MDQIFAKTRELGQALLESEVYAKMKEAETKAMQNMKAAEMMASYLEKRQQIQAMMEEEIARLKAEEELLTKELPGYADYKKKVKYRLIPFIW